MEQAGDHEELLLEVFTTLVVFLTQSNLTAIADTFIATFSNLYCGFLYICIFRNLNELVV